MKIFSEQALWEATNNFRHISSWYGIGLQILVPSGWRPDCVQVDSPSVERTLPPRLTQRGIWIAAGSADSMQWDHGATKGVPVPKGGIEDPSTCEVEVATFYTGGYATSCSCIKMPNG